MKETGTSLVITNTMQKINTYNPSTLSLGSGRMRTSWTLRVIETCGRAPQRGLFSDLYRSISLMVTPSVSSRGYGKS